MLQFPQPTGNAAWESMMLESLIEILFVKCLTHTKRHRNTKETYFELNESFVWSAWGVNQFQRAEHADSVEAPL